MGFEIKLEKKLEADGEVIVDYKTSCAIFNYSFKISNYYFNLVQIGDGKFDLKINSFFFKDLKEAEEQGLLKHYENNNNDYNNNDYNNNEDNDDYYNKDKINNKNNYNEENDDDNYNPEKGLID